MAATTSSIQSKGIFILPKPTPGTATLPSSIIISADSNTILDSAKRLALNGSPSAAITPSPAKSSTTGSSTDSQAKLCKRKLNFAKLGLPDKHKASPKTVEKRNARERNRVKTINGNFECLRDHLPCGDSVMQRKRQKKMSKVDILKGALDYISMLKDLLDETDRESNSSSAPSSPCPTSPGSYIPGSPCTSTSYPSPSPQATQTPSTHQHHSSTSLISQMRERYPMSASGSFLAALSDTSIAPSSQTMQHSPAPVSPAESLPSSTCSVSSSCSSITGSDNVTDISSMMPHTPALLTDHNPQWEPDDDELRNFATWFQ
uniref:Achaete-scute A4 transcription factor n=1 Tax=Malacoceros fuliginosus TaxID=271776 RepID=A0A7G9UKX5_MALFL|nr:achaete-scute A4 transcription factor [Malacoceros fuliginosus]